MEEPEAGPDSGTVELNIRSPVSTLDDLRIVCPLDWRVARVKQKIFELFPGNPPPKGQKLVYAGKLLEDQERLQEFIRFQDECSIYTIHLVCNMLQSTLNESELRRRKAEPVSPTVEDNTQEAVTLNSWAQYLQFSNQIQISEDNIQQMAAMQEMYTQYLSQYMQYMQTGTPVPQPDIQGVRNEGEREGGRAPVVMNAGAGEPGQAFQEDEEQGNRDMLDWLYISIRILILLSVVYFYSSFSRFALVTLIFLVLYSFQVGFWQDHRDRDNIQQEVNNIRDPQQPPEPPSQEDQPPPPPQPSFLSVLSTFLSTFFTSIIPEQNQVV